MSEEQKRGMHKLTQRRREENEPQMNARGARDVKGANVMGIFVAGKGTTKSADDKHL